MEVPKLNEIVEGWTNFLTGQAKAEGQVRMRICSGMLEGFPRCEHFRESLINFCGHCNCPLQMKSRTLKQGGCPIGKW